jgi:hypothetical protein
VGILIAGGLVATLRVPGNVAGGKITQSLLRRVFATREKLRNRRDRTINLELP